MALDRSNPKSLAKYREYQKEYHRQFSKKYYKYDVENKKNIICIKKFLLYLGIFYWKFKR